MDLQGILLIRGYGWAINKDRAKKDLRAVVKFLSALEKIPIAKRFFNGPGSKWLEKVVLSWILYKAKNWVK